MNRPLLRSAATLLGVALTVTGCGTRDVVVADSPPASAAAASPSAAPGAASVAFPEIPPIVVPDVTALTTASKQFTEALGDLVTPVSGIEVTGARCDATGRVVNRGSLTAVQGGDGSAQVADGKRTVTTDGDGSGVLSDGDRTISVNADGSGDYSDGLLTISINRDGSGTYSDAATTVTVNADGSGNYSDGQRTVTIDKDGSGNYAEGDLTVSNAGDGSGTFSSGAHTVVNNGDGTGLVDGAQVAMPPLDPVPPVGRFPSVAALDPVGRACGTLIRLSDRVLFDFAAATLRPDAGPVLDRLARALSGVTAPLAVNGHTDAKGDDAYNLDLSQRRAAAVVAALQQRGVAQELAASGFGESQPIADNERGGRDFPAGRQLTRRGEIGIPGG